jgi:NTP pyrophosphatase (non-canonical NTP hydrolase)
MIKIEDCREEVKEFACFMEEILRKHDDRSWKKCRIEWLYSRLDEEVIELNSAIEDKSPVAIQHECGDVANFAMMIWDVSR